MPESTSPETTSEATPALRRLAAAILMTAEEMEEQARLLDESVRVLLARLRDLQRSSADRIRRARHARKRAVLSCLRVGGKHA